jgi:hypothetical protein
MVKTLVRARENSYQSGTERFGYLRDQSRPTMGFFPGWNYDLLEGTVYARTGPQKMARMWGIAELQATRLNTDLSDAGGAFLAEWKGGVRRLLAHREKSHRKNSTKR